MKLDVTIYMSQERDADGKFIETVTLDDVLAVLTETHEPVTGPEVSDRLAISNRSALTKLDELHDRGDIERKQVGARAVVWWVATDDDSAFARRQSRKAIAHQHGDDYYGENPGWAEDLPSLGENA